MHKICSEWNDARQWTFHWQTIWVFAPLKGSWSKKEDLSRLWHSGQIFRFSSCDSSTGPSDRFRCFECFGFKPVLISVTSDSRNVHWTITTDFYVSKLWFVRWAENFDTICCKLIITSISLFVRRSFFIISCFAVPSSIFRTMIMDNLIYAHKSIICALVANDTNLRAILKIRINRK